MSFTGNGITSCYPDEVENFISITVLTQLTLVLVLFTDATRIDLAHLRLEESLPARLLGIGLPLTVAAGALAAWTSFSSSSNHRRPCTEGLSQSIDKKAPP